MHTNNISAETTSLEFQLRLHEEMLDTAMKHDFEFAKAKVIYQEYKKLRNKIQEIKKEENSKFA